MSTGRLSRSGTEPPFGVYLTDYAIVPHQRSSIPRWIDKLRVKWISIPSFQRGISWDLDNVRDLIHSKSFILGNVVLSTFPTPEKAHWKSLCADYSEIVDGLQRFAAGTSILHVLLTNVFDPKATYAKLNQLHLLNIELQYGSRMDVVAHNHDMLLNHPRIAIKQQYTEFYEIVKEYIIAELDQNPDDLAQNLGLIFLDRQVAIDMYLNFRNLNEVMHTFLGINTVREELGPIDILRATLVHQAEIGGWSREEQADMENDFSDAFMKRNKLVKELAPFVNALMNKLATQDAEKVFNTWGKLDQSEVDGFITFVNDFKNTLTQVSTSAAAGYLREIWACGKNSVSIMLAYYYSQFRRTGKRPGFMQTPAGASKKELVELHQFLVSNYLAFLNGKIGKIGELIPATLVGSRKLSIIAEDITKTYSPHTLGQKPNRSWLKSSIQMARKGKSSRIFNAMLLPKHKQGVDFGGQFEPLVYGRGDTLFEIDHLIPRSKLSGSGKRAGNTIRNFAPLISPLNNEARATLCSTKLKTKKFFSSHHHPYHDWLLGVHAIKHGQGDLDDQTNIELNKSISDERVDYIVDELMNRL